MGRFSGVGLEGGSFGGGQEMNQNNCKYCNTKAISDTQSGSAKSEAVENNSAKIQRATEKKKDNKMTSGTEGEIGGAEGVLATAEGAKINKAHC